eukprot:gnl/Ergobibamus_cyprinoides/5186.p3 GENE.gnl/Ergobibamus_cyprinoides/5186~~gnl/Ergobibamus_cyprinoides/5186.p3  ORF type:complete len:186 (-),score=18.20 gnl/Ergobibamus_cyprinoides/5186:32-589(-)
MTRSRLWYDACPDCGRKVQGAPGAYECMKCGKTQMPACSRKFCGAVKVQDYTGSSVMRFFDQAGQQLLGATADDLYKVNATAYAAAGLSGAGGDAESPDGNPEYSEELLRELAKKTHRVGRMRCIARRDEYNGEERQSVTTIQRVRAAARRLRHQGRARGARAVQGDAAAVRTAAPSPSTASAFW